MNDIDYAYTKIFNMRLQNDKTYPRYIPDTKFVDSVTLTSGLTDATRDTHTLTGDVNPSPSRELLIKIVTIGREPNGDIVYPTAVRIGLTVDTIDDSDLDYLDDDYYSQFKWFNMIPIDSYTFAIYPNQIFGMYMKNGVLNHIKFIYRVFDNQGNEYKYHNPHYLDNTKHSYWEVNANKVSINKAYVPTNVDLLLDGYNAYIGECDEDCCREFTLDVGQNSFLATDTTPLGAVEEASETKWTRDARNTTSQFERVHIIVNLGPYWSTGFDLATVRLYISNASFSEDYAIYMKPATNKTFSYDVSFKIADLMGEYLKVGAVNKWVSMQIGIKPYRHGSYEPEIMIPTTLQILLPETYEGEFDPDDLGVLFSKIANY